MASFAHDKAVDLSYGQQRKVEIARALATNPELLLLDEPAAGMNPSETEELVSSLKKHEMIFDLTVLLIEHDMKFVNQMCDKVLVSIMVRQFLRVSQKRLLKILEVIAAYLGDFHND